MTLLSVSPADEHIEGASMNEGMAFVQSSSENLWHLSNFTNKLQFSLHTNKNFTNDYTRLFMDIVNDNVAQLTFIFQ